MSNLEGNAYTAPQADLRLKGDENNITNLPRISAWLVLLLTIITFGIYPVYWLYTRTKAVNEMQSKPINIFLAQALVIILIGTFVVGLVSGATESDLSAISNILSVLYFIIFIVLAYSIRSRLHDIFKANNHDAKIGPILTFFFNAIYMQYKINQAIDAKA